MLRVLQAALPGESFIYAADSANAPYGDKSQAFIEARTAAMANFLVGQCQGHRGGLQYRHGGRGGGAAHSPRDPGYCHGARHQTRCTTLAIGSGGCAGDRKNLGQPGAGKVVPSAYAANAHIIPQPCPGLVELVEAGAAGMKAAEPMLRRYLAPRLLLARGADTIVLGCTHYVFLAEQIRSLAGPGVTVIESSEAVARQVERRLAERRMLAVGSEKPVTRFFTTGSVERAQAVISGIPSGGHRCKWTRCRAIRTLKYQEGKPMVERRPDRIETRGAMLLAGLRRQHEFQGTRAHDHCRDSGRNFARWARCHGMGSQAYGAICGSSHTGFEYCRRSK